mmetsp:Transcript_29577/g.33767  ORF Transcript_29577/g.33767 Transcript_29577/m.33767 type:complete len:634 (+) Transcript_29577:130-2031(+)
MPPNSSSNAIPKSPFFAPSESRNNAVTASPGGTRRSSSTVQETKSSAEGATFNLINAIVGSGIVGIPYAVKQAGLLPGIVLITLCAILTDKSLRLLIETAKHANAPTYETTMEAAYGKFGFLFVTINMFVMSYGAMVSYLMIVKDTLPYVFGITDLGTRRGVLFLLSLFVMVPLSAQRDIAKLAKTSRISVVCDIVMVGLLVYLAPIGDMLRRCCSSSADDAIDWSAFVSKVVLAPPKWDTLFVGLGVLSFAFVCQHSGFIIAGSLDNPTNVRWGRVTRRSLLFCALLANLCGVAGYLGFAEDTKGNILNNLEDDDIIANVARGMLGLTMLFVYPMESFVTRHVCVVTFFVGRRAHEGEDATILNRSDRRITLTVALYFLALIPAIMFENLGNVLSLTGAVGGSCLCYIGPGLLYMGIHGKRFCEIVDKNYRSSSSDSSSIVDEEKQTLLQRQQNGNSNTTTKSSSSSCINTICYYLLGIPFWYWIASIGAKNFQSHEQDMSTKSPHTVRKIIPVTGGKKIIMSKHLVPPKKSLLKKSGSGSELIDAKRSSSYGSVAAAASIANTITVIPPQNKILFQQHQPVQKQAPVQPKQDEEEPKIIPQVMDYAVAISFMLLGIVAFLAGIASLYISET